MSPLGPFLDRLTGGTADPDEALQVFADELAVCMQSEGFDFVSFVPEPIDIDFDDGLPDNEHSFEWASIFGFGFSTLAFNQSQVGDDLVGDPGISGPNATPADPNTDYYASLRVDEQRAFDRALYGDVTTNDSGCQTRASTVAWGDETVRQTILTHLAAELSDLDARVTTDPRVMQYQNDLQACVSAEGFDFVDIDTTGAALGQRVDAIQRELPQSGPDEAEVAQMSDEEFEELMNSPIELPELTAEQKAVLAEIQAEEIELAKAVHKCGGIQALSQLRQVVRVELEVEFLSENEGQIIALLE